AKNYFLLESNYTGYVVFAPEIERFELDKFQKIFIYHHRNDYIDVYYGFKEFKERLFFEDLLSIQGIGPKTGIAILNEGWKNALQLISTGDWEKLSKMPHLGQRSAKQLVFEFQSKYNTILSKKSLNKNQIELEDTLKILGFNKKQISLALESINETLNIEEMVENAIKIISNEQHTKIT
ncbi:MAG: Holliday junction branch migration protein RuvA, partial [Mycoplasmataceae bacterium]|nr:Holliday junction branch migration protein RuvA [Mycoplasmataceae bacterium]